MSVAKVQGKSGSKWEVRWREGRSHRKRTFARKADAQEFEAHVKRAKQRGALGAIAKSDLTLDELAVEWFAESVVPTLAVATQKSYSGVYHRHIQPTFGDLRLAEINVRRIDRYKADLLAVVGTQTVRLALTVLQSMLQKAVEWGYIEINPVRSVSKRLGVKAKPVNAIGPVGVEAMRRCVMSRDRRPTENLRDATFISMLAYAGLRPSELLALRWGKIGENTILVDCSASFGQEKGTKTGQSRSVDLVKPLKRDLAEWRLASGSTGGLWNEDAYRNWRKRVFRPAATEAGINGSRPYAFRHGFVSLLLHAGLSVAEVSHQAGHGPDVTLKTYAHVIAEMKGMPHQPVQDAINDARLKAGVPHLYLDEDSDEPSNAQEPLSEGKPTRGLEPRTPSLRVKCSTS